MASIVMYEILTSIRLHPFLLTAAEIHRLSEGDAREVDGMIAQGFRKGRHPNNVRHHRENYRVITLRKG